MDQIRREANSHLVLEKAKNKSFCILRLNCEQSLSCQPWGDTMINDDNARQATSFTGCGGKQFALLIMSDNLCVSDLLYVILQLPTFFFKLKNIWWGLFIR